MTGVTTHPADNCGVIGSKLRPTYLKHGAKSFQLANPTSGLVTYTLSLVGWDGMGYKLAGTGVATAQKFVQRPTPFLTRHYITYMRNLIHLHQQRGGLVKHEPEYLYIMCVTIKVDASETSSQSWKCDM